MMGDAKQQAMDDWHKFLNPQTLKSNLISASLYMAAWETFEYAVIDRVESFYMVGFDGDGFKFSDDYKNKVLSRDKSRFRASMLWFQDNGAVDNADLALADRARQHRNDIAHELPKYVTKSSHNIDVALLADLSKLLDKIEVWWIRNIELSIDPEALPSGVDADSIPDDQIRSGRSMFLSMMFNIAAGDDAEASRYFDEFVKMGAGQ